MCQQKQALHTAAAGGNFYCQFLHPFAHDMCTANVPPAVIQGKMPLNATRIFPDRMLIETTSNKHACMHIATLYNKVPCVQKSNTHACKTWGKRACNIRAQACMQKNKPCMQTNQTNLHQVSSAAGRSPSRNLPTPFWFSSSLVIY